PNDTRITLARQDTPVTFPAKIDTAEGPVTVFDPGFQLMWEMQGA
ncbi:MAG: dihydroorotase, partial [Rhizobiaceae bacterium]|nr:dihydroorotase [Rhizobiaceae bacterium]